MSQKNMQLTHDEFEELKSHLSKRANVDALYQVMVVGRSQADVARECDVSRKAISQSVGRAWLLHVEHGNRPPGWVVVNAALPPEMADVVQDMARRARLKLGINHDEKKNEVGSDS